MLSGVTDNPEFCLFCELYVLVSGCRLAQTLFLQPIIKSSYYLYKEGIYIMYFYYTGVGSRDIPPDIYIYFE